MQPTCFPLWIFHWGELCCHLILIRWFTVVKKIYMLPTWRSLSVYRYMFISSGEVQAFIPACFDKILLSSYFKRITLYEFHIVTVTDSTVHGFITNQHNNQFSLGLSAQLVEHYTGIAKVIGSNPVQAWVFFQVIFSLLLRSVYCGEDRSSYSFHMSYTSLWKLVG